LRLCAFARNINHPVNQQRLILNFELIQFLGEQKKPIHERNWHSESFEKLAKSITGMEIDYSERTPAYAMDAYTSRTLPR
jgi:hypothetical protein